MSRILVDQIRSNSASADALTLDGSGNITVPGNLVVTGNANCNGTPTGFGGGKVLKHQLNEFTNTVATSGEYPQNIFSWTFTPTSASSTIFMFMSAPILVYSAGNQTYRNAEYALWHDTTTELTASYMSRSDNPASAGSLTVNGSLHGKHESHNTTSAITYRIRAGWYYAATSVYFNDESSNASPHTSIITLEVA